MLQTKQYKIKSCDDIELEIKRESLLEFSLYFDDEKEIEAVLFIIAGLGEDNNKIYQDKLANHSTSAFPVAVCLVDYNCISNRPATGCDICFDDIDTMILNELLNILNIKIPKKFLPLQNLRRDKLWNFIQHIDKNLEKRKQKLELTDSFKLLLSATFLPAKNEYNNFGIMSAIDIINALLHIKKDPPFKIANGGGGF